ncbi:hypothetical protein A2U01_0076509, partial [Trifolium medium]|nr:hypothetical protein [Trifolium medium]
MLSSVFTSTAALVNLSRYDLMVSSSLYTIASSTASVFGWRLKAVKYAVKRRHISVQESTDPGGKLLYHVIAPFRSVVGN